MIQVKKFSNTIKSIAEGINTIIMSIAEEINKVLNINVKLVNGKGFVVLHNKFFMQYDMHNFKIDKTSDIENKGYLSIVKLSKLQLKGCIKIHRIIFANKQSQKYVINEQFVKATKLTSIVKTGFDFLDVFIRQNHPKFRMVPIISENTLKLSDANNLRDYCS